MYHANHKKKETKVIAKEKPGGNTCIHIEPGKGKNEKDHKKHRDQKIRSSAKKQKKKTKQ